MIYPSVGQVKTPLTDTYFDQFGDWRSWCCWISLCYSATNRIKIQQWDPTYPTNNRPRIQQKTKLVYNYQRITYPTNNRVSINYKQTTYPTKNQSQYLTIKVFHIRITIESVSTINILRIQLKPGLVSNNPTINRLRI